MKASMAANLVADAPDFGAPETNGYALASLILGIFWLFGFGSLAAIYLGFRALREISVADGRQSGRAFAWGGIVTGLFGLTSSGLIIAVAVKAG